MPVPPPPPTSGSAPQRSGVGSGDGPTALRAMGRAARPWGRRQRLRHPRANDPTGVSAAGAAASCAPPPPPPQINVGWDLGTWRPGGGRGTAAPRPYATTAAPWGAMVGHRESPPPRPPIPPTSPSARIAPLGTHRRATQSAPPRLNAAPHSGSDPAARIDADRAATCVAFEYRDAGRPRSAERGTGPGAARTAPHRTAAGQSYRERPPPPQEWGSAGSPDAGSGPAALCFVTAPEERRDCSTVPDRDRVRPGPGAAPLRAPPARRPPPRTAPHRTAEPRNGSAAQPRGDASKRTEPPRAPQSPAKPRTHLRGRGRRARPAGPAGTRPGPAAAPCRRRGPARLGSVRIRSARLGPVRPRSSRRSARGSARPAPAHRHPRREGGGAGGGGRAAERGRAGAGRGGAGR